jgi:hypothetical protein
MGARVAGSTRVAQWLLFEVTLVSSGRDFNIFNHCVVLL